MYHVRDESTVLPYVPACYETSLIWMYYGIHDILYAFRYNLRKKALQIEFSNVRGLQFFKLFLTLPTYGLHVIVQLIIESGIVLLSTKSIDALC